MIEVQQIELSQWNAAVSGLPWASFLQTAEWAQIKAGVGWQALPLTWVQRGKLRAAALVLERRLSVRGISLPVAVQYAPRGPLLDDWYDPLLRQNVLNDLMKQARQRGALQLKLDAMVPLAWGDPNETDAQDDPAGMAWEADLVRLGWRPSEEQIQFRNSVLIDLAPSEEDLLAVMKQKTRYNIRLAERKGVRVRQAGLDDLDLLYRMYAHTALRDGFVIRHAGYYHELWRTFFQAGLGEAWIAEAGEDGQPPVPLAALVIVRFGGLATYLHGMSLDEQREKMPNYLLQWQAMRSARAAGCHTYDLWGAPDVFDESDGMWGVYRFKRGLGGRVLRTPGAWDYPANPLLYGVYTRLLPRVLSILRRRGVEQTRQAFSA